IDENQIDNVMGELRERLGDLLRQSIRPEFLNRIDEIVLFKPLTHKEIREIVELQLKILVAMLKAKDLKLSISDETKNWLANVGYDVTFGARPLKRTIQKYLVNPLSQELLAGNFVGGDTIKVNVGEDAKLEFSK
ncbi:MAG: type VI secretion system ATPase TssH, partial [Ignavibacteria bacterium]|nr:type VI secretion system ATPase TssH [Ignavibacteria bacterium]